jgi:hypothetical protein
MMEICSDRRVRRHRPDLHHRRECNVVRSLIPRARTRVGGDVGQVLAHVHDAEIEIGEAHQPPSTPLH